MAAVPIKKFKCMVESAGGETMTFIRMPFDAREVFGKGRVPVKLTINGYTYPTTISHMGGMYCVPLRREHRENAGVKAGDQVQIRVELDAEPRVVEVPADLKKFLQANQVWGLFDQASYTHQKEFVQWITGAKKEETRQARQAKMVEMLRKKAHL